jgi:hypothetical protein
MKERKNKGAKRERSELNESIEGGKREGNKMHGGR